MIWALSYDNTDLGQELLASMSDNYLSNKHQNAFLNPSEISISLYPNPFNSFCQFNLALSKGKFLKIAINDINGRTIKSFDSKHYKAGSHIVGWNAEYNSSGIYFISFQTDKELSTKKIMLIK